MVFTNDNAFTATTEIHSRLWGLSSNGIEDQVRGLVVQILASKWN